MAWASYANKLVLTQLPQNLGARGKGNWPLKTSRLQSFVGCSISWCCVMTSKRASKSKSAKAYAGEMAKVTSKVHAKVSEGEACWLRSRPSRHRMRLILLSPQAGALLYLLKPACRAVSFLPQSQISLPGMSQRVDGYPSPHLQTYSTMTLAQEES
jgi:hypothetical protein